MTTPAAEIDAMPQPLTDRQRAFVRLMARGARSVDAFKAAGYAPRITWRTTLRPIPAESPSRRRCTIHPRWRLETGA